MHFEYFSNLNPNFVQDVRGSKPGIKPGTLASTGFSSSILFLFFPQLVDHATLIPLLMSEPSCLP